MADTGVVGLAYVEIRPLLDNFGRAVETEVAAGGALDSDLKRIGSDAGATLGSSIGSGANAELSKVKLSGLLGPDGAPLVSSFATAGADAGSALGVGIGASAAKEVANASPKVESEAKKFYTKVAGTFSSFGSVLQNAGFTGGALFDKIGSKIEKAGKKSDETASKWTHLGNVSILAGGAIAAGIGYESVKAGEAFQSSTAMIAASAGISQAAANTIGNAFQTTAFKATENSTTIANAYGTVVAQLQGTQGHVLSATQALGFMNTALTLNDALAGELGDTTTDLSKVTNAYHLTLGQTAAASNVLYTASGLTGSSLDTLTDAVDKLHGKLGDTGPSLQDTAALVTELSKSGTPLTKITTSIGSGFATLLSGSTAVNKELAALGPNGGQIAKLQTQLKSLDTTVVSSTKAVSPFKTQIAQLRTEIAAYGSQKAGTAGAIALKNLKQQLAEVTAQQDTWAASNKTTVTPSITNQKKVIDAEIASLQKTGVQLFNAKGQFIGTSAAIGQLHNAFRDLTGQQQIQAATTLVGRNAASLFVKVIDSGTASFDKYTTAVGKVGGVETAAEKNSATLKSEIGKIDSGFHDTGTTIGLELIPAIQKALPWISDLAQGISKVVIGALNLGTALDKLIQKQLKSSTGSGEPSHITSALQTLGFKVGTSTTGPLTKSTAAYLATHLTKAQRAQLDGGASISQFESDLRAGGASSQQFINAAEQQVSVNNRASKLLTPADSAANRKPKPEPVARVPRTPGKAGNTVLHTYLDGKKVASAVSKHTAARVKS